MIPELFNVVFYDEEGFWDYALREVEVERAWNEAVRLIMLSEADDNDFDRILITDENDNTCFLWRYGEGVIFPKPEVRQQIVTPAAGPSSNNG